ncbi:Gametolysin peptidase M11-domain-containing protein, partial [Haematococcus lacustris]
MIAHLARCGAQVQNVACLGTGSEVSKMGSTSMHRLTTPGLLFALVLARLVVVRAQDCSRIRSTDVLRGTFYAMHLMQRGGLDATEEPEAPLSQSAYALKDATGELSNLVFTRPDLVDATGLTSGRAIRVWIDAAATNSPPALSPSNRFKTTVFALCYEAVVVRSLLVDYKPVNGQPHAFSSVTMLVSSCGSGPVVDLATLHAAYFDPNPVMTRGPLSGAGQSLTTFFTNCSFGGATFVPANNIIVPVEVPCSGNTTSGAELRPAASFCEMRDQFAWMEHADSVVLATYGAAALARFTNRIYILPAGSCGSFAYATQGCNPGWCFSTTVYVRQLAQGRVLAPKTLREQVTAHISCSTSQQLPHQGRLDWSSFGALPHELGHTMGLAHSASPTDEYGDGSTPMGNPWAGPRCYNAPQQWQLGWSRPLQDITATTLAPGSWLTVQLPGLVLQSASFVRVTPTWKAGATTPTYFISYRPAVGHDSGLGANGLANMVHIHTYNWSAVPAAVDWRPMWLGKLGAVGAIWSDPWASNLRVRLTALAPDLMAASVGVCRYITSAESGADCFDGLDNDCNGLTDSQDPNCKAGAPSIVPGCNNNLICEPQLGETPLTCLGDCPTQCGDGFCSPRLNKTASSCPVDCPAVCGDSYCDSARGEDDWTCPTDCPVCGDGICQSPAENCASCSRDCCPCTTAFCGDGICSAFAGENCLTCPGDCLRSGTSPFSRTGQYCCGLAPLPGRCHTRCGVACYNVCPFSTGSLPSPPLPPSPSPSPSPRPSPPLPRSPSP